VEQSTLKMVDFGFSCLVKQDGFLTTRLGTPRYSAPQVLAGRYDLSCDLWSCGVIMYVMLCGYPPFNGQTDEAILNKVRRGVYSFNAGDWKRVSEDAKNLIRSLLKMNPKERFNAEQALNHEWIADKAPKAEQLPLQAGLVENLRSFRSQNKLKKAALQIIAGQLSEDKIRALRQTFTTLDGNGDGLLTAEEMKEGVKRAGLKVVPSDLEQILEEVDSDGSGIIDYTEFLAATLDYRLYIQEDVCWAAFRVFDRNGNGRISPSELRAVLQRGDVQDVCGAHGDAVAAVMEEVDRNKDGHIDFEEFMAMMRKKH